MDWNHVEHERALSLKQRTDIFSIFTFSPFMASEIKVRTSLSMDSEAPPVPSSRCHRWKGEVHTLIIHRAVPSAPGIKGQESEST
ncbi:hypothetical protein EVAR_68440_1 [Eumeta japonica]|uniref:Uncharacterized protein n=1 Tax=Eumeta variegata TaxID=151549 RepID=A0A4C1ZXD9_EUMVA|nr:hypothetical protein EVAR_68440_1 [Eumeta japonica]